MYSELHLFFFFFLTHSLYGFNQTQWPIIDQKIEQTRRGVNSRAEGVMQHFAFLIAYMD